jgi:GT2 family glycosyltransferase
VKLKISIVIPTHNRSGILVQTLNSLAVQTVPADVYDVTVVADGCRDDTAARVRSLTLPYAVRLIEQSPRGAAAARNRGAAEVSSSLILFLDDDMEAMPRLIAAHLEVHAQVWRGVVMGYFSAPRASQPDDIFLKSIDLWWNDHFSEMSSPGHRYTFRDVCTGNLSLPKELFQAAGCFDEAFLDKSGEDYELGLRLLKMGAPFRFAPQAMSVHHYLPTIARVRQRAFDEGRGHVLMARKHPETFPALPLIQGVDGGPRVQIVRWIRLRPWMMAAVPPLLALPERVTRSLRFRRRWQRLFGFILTCAYWRGVLCELGSYAEMVRFMNDMPLTPSNFVEMELDLARDRKRMDAILEDRPADAVAIRYGARPIGWMEPVPGSERLRPAHVRHAVANRWGYEYLSALLRQPLEQPRDPSEEALRRRIEGLALPGERTGDSVKGTGNR